MRNYSVVPYLETQFYIYLESLHEQMLASSEPKDILHNKLLTVKLFRVTSAKDKEQRTFLSQRHFSNHKGTDTTELSLKFINLLPVRGCL